jgi:hypothetical protein
VRAWLAVWDRLRPAALKKAGVEVALPTVMGPDHGSACREINRMVQDFFDKRLKPAATQPTTQKTE